MNPIHSKSLTAKLELIPLFTTGRLITSLFFKVFQDSSFNNSFRRKMYELAKDYVHLRSEESLTRNLILALPVIGQIIILADEILMRTNVSYFLFRSGDNSLMGGIICGALFVYYPYLIGEPIALEELSAPMPASFRDDPRVINSVFRLDAHRSKYWTVGFKFPSELFSGRPFLNAGNELRKNKKYILGLIENPPFKDLFHTLSPTFDLTNACRRVLSHITLESESKRDEDRDGDLLFSRAYIDIIHYVFIGMDDSLKTDRELVEKFLNVHPFLFKYLSEDLKKDERILEVTERRIQETFDGFPPDKIPKHFD